MNYIEVIALLIAFIVLFGAILELFNMASPRVLRSPFVVGPTREDRSLRTTRLTPKGVVRR